MTSMQRLEFNCFGDPYMPIRLKATLARNGIKQNDWCAAVIQTNGFPLSGSAGTQIINWNTWPKNTPEHSIKKQTEDYLKTRGVPEAEIQAVWDHDPTDSARMQHAVGVHTGQYQRASQEKANALESLGEIEMLSPNAKKHFKLFQDPFNNDVNGPEDVFLSEDQRYVRQSMLLIAKHGGIMAVVAESGGGKSVLRRDLDDRIKREGLPITMIFPRAVDKTRLTAGSICEAIIKDLNPEAKVPQSLESKARIVEKLLKASGQAGNSHVILIEEAHDLTIQVLKLLKRFFEVEDGFRKLVSIILVGQPELRKKLDERSYPEAREFIRRCEMVELVAMDRVLKDYLAFKFKRLDKDASEVFEEDAFDAIRDLLNNKRMGCYPLNINNLVIKAMNLSAEIGEEKISAAVIQQI